MSPVVLARSALRRRLAAIALSLVILAGPAWAAHDVLNIGISQFPANFNPLIDPLVAKSYIEGMARRSFTVYDKDWKLACLLCTRVPSLENGGAVKEPLGNGRTGVAITYTIQPEARWGDGVPITTDDVTFTWEVGKSPSSGIADADLFNHITSIDVKDSKTFTLHFDRLVFDYAAINDFEILPAHLERPAFADPSQYRDRSLYETDTTNPGLYDGPYLITQVERGQFVVLEPNPYWWGTKPYFKRIVVKSIEVTPYLEANLLSGNVDMIPGEIGFTLDAAFAFMTRHRPEWNVTFKPGLSYEHVSVNLDNPAWSDVRMRRALLYGLDRASMIREIFQGKQQVADSLVNPLDWVFQPDVPKYPYDQAMANRLMDEAGWPRGPDGNRRNAQGTPLTIDLMTTAGLRNREVMELFMQQAWQRLGIPVAIRNQPARTFFGDTVLHRLYRDLAMFAWVSAPENVPFAELYSTQVPSQDNNWSGENSGGYRSARMDRLIDAIQVELDRDKRKALWAELQRLYATDLPDLPLTFRSDPYVLPTWLEGVEPTGNEDPSTLWVEDWRAKE